VTSARGFVRESRGPGGPGELQVEMAVNQTVRQGRGRESISATKPMSSLKSQSEIWICKETVGKSSCFAFFELVQSGEHAKHLGNVAR
jgi:hypothetical protein